MKRPYIKVNNTAINNIISIIIEDRRFFVNFSDSSYAILMPR